MTPLEAAKEALNAWDRNIPHEIVQDLHWSDIADPWQAASFVQGYITALIDAERRLADLEMILRAANEFDGVRIDKGVFMKTRWTILRREFSTEGGKPRLHGVTSFNFEEDGVTPILTDEARAALAGDPK